MSKHISATAVALSHTDFIGQGSVLLTRYWGRICNETLQLHAIRSPGMLGTHTMQGIGRSGIQLTLNDQSVRPPRIVQAGLRNTMKY